MSTTTTTDLGVYQAAVRRLTAENADLRRQLTAEQASHLRDVRTLKTELLEGLTPELQELRRQLGRWRDRAIRAEQRLGSILRERT